MTLSATSASFCPSIVLSYPALVARRVRTGVAVFVTVLFLAGTADAAGTATLTRTESSLLTAMNEARRAPRRRPHRAGGRRERLVGVGALRGTFGRYRGALMVTTDFAGR
jgi:hypothetical protein